ncbi:MAG: molybdopterin synthase sulfur carrier subunit [Bacteroidia bacterium]|jgi:molybdopterin synthase sulfur carrier subunit
MKIKIKYFGMIAEWTDASTESFETTGNTVGDLAVQLQEVVPELGKISFQIAVNQSIASQEMELNENDEVAVLPPFAGG